MRQGPSLPPSRDGVSSCQSDELLRLDVQPDREIVRVFAVGELDCSTGPALRDEVDALLAVGFAKVLLDLRDLTFIDVAGTRAVLAADVAAHRGGARLDIIVHRGVADLWDRLGVTELLVTRPQIDDVLSKAAVR